jgi:hypothetical protein
MTRVFREWKSSPVATLRLVWLSAALLVVGLQVAAAKDGREPRNDGQTRAGGKPVMAIVSLRDQRISIYDVRGKFLEAPVSTGSTGYETPAGIFSIVQKKEMHSSNLYEDGEMPFMQRITWTGIALHAGVLPGRPASHGCIRLPSSFAEHLFGLTDLGMRVLVVRDDMSPSDIGHPVLFKSIPAAKELAAALPNNPVSTNKGAAEARFGPSRRNAEVVPGSARYLQLLQSIAAAKTEEVATANKRLQEARAAATRATAEEAGTNRLLRASEANLVKAEAALKDMERRLETATTPQIKERIESAKAKALIKIEEIQSQLQAARLQAQARRSAAEHATGELGAAAADRDRAADAADEATRKALPVSVFISRKTQRLYVRKGNYPIYEGPVSIRDAQATIGTFVFTALEPLGTSGEMRWNVVAMYRNPTSIEPSAPARNASAAPTDVNAANAALDRIVFAPEALDAISDIVWPGSSLIISDEGPSRETGKDTDFVVVMSGEPQGALKMRQREPMPMGGWFERSPFRGMRSFWD